MAPLTWRQEGWGSGDSPCPSGSVKPGLFFAASQAAAETPCPQKALVRAAGGKVPSGVLGTQNFQGTLKVMLSGPWDPVSSRWSQEGRPSAWWSPALPAVETGSGQPFPDGAALGAGPWVGAGEPRGGTDRGRCGRTGSSLLYCLGPPHQVKKLLTGPWGGGPQASGLRQDKGPAYGPGFFRALSVCSAPWPRVALSLGAGTGWEGQHGTGGGGQVGCAADLGGRPSHCLPPGTSQAPRRARKRAEGGASSNVFSMFDQSQIQEFKEVSPCALWATRSVSAMHGKHPRGWQGPGSPLVPGGDDDVTILRAPHIVPLSPET